MDWKTPTFEQVLQFCTTRNCHESALIAESEDKKSKDAGPLAWIGKLFGGDPG